MEMSDDELKEILVYRPSQSIDLRIDDDSDPIWALALLAGLSFWGFHASVILSVRVDLWALLPVSGVALAAGIMNLGLGFWNRRPESMEDRDGGHVVMGSALAGSLSLALTVLIYASDQIILGIIWS